jgi:16S rRNA (guanine(1405)-N(7))-methyltransferase
MAGCAAYGPDQGRIPRRAAPNDAGSRLPFLESFYARTLASLRPIRSVVDVACGLNPLAMPWMGLEDDVRYRGYDLYSDMTDFLASALHASLFSPKCDAEMETRDVVAEPLRGGADLALVLKFLPLLEQSGVEDVPGWLRALQARHALVSFPTRTLGGRNVGMARAYESRFVEMARDARWSVERFEFGNEICFLVEF